MRWLLLDKVLSIHKGKKAIASSKVPQAPYSSEILLVEMMAQAGGLLVGAESDYQKDLIFAKIENVTFTEMPKSGTPIQIETWADGLGPDGGWLEGHVTCAEGVLAKGKFLLMTVGRLIPEHASSITFHEAFMNYFKVREKIFVES
ncbi:MAG TPA: hypothetical protein PLO78_09430 [Candidatus Omnitrophota bacterium]|nr:hypothetical protein [Candidatus Omnitrophota bacterium]